jgi:pimeloyl-ACP methyl ester carboxylesterase
MMRQIELSAGTIEYSDRGAGPVVLLLHGLLMDGSLWDNVVVELADNYRCIVPTLPMGAHRHAMRAKAEISMQGLSRLVRELLERLDLRDVTVVGVDTGGAVVQLIAAEGCPRVARIVLAPSDAFDNFPPGLTGKTVVLLGALPPTLFGLLMQPLRLKPFRRLPIAFGWLTKRGDATTARWLKPILRQAAVRRDTVRLLRSIGAQRDLLVHTAERLSAFNRPALIVWTPEDRVMPPEHGRRLTEVFADGRLIEISDSYTLMPLDQPVRLARAIAEFIHDLGIHGDARVPAR